MNLLTPAQACTWLQGFINRVDRLTANNYTIPRLRTEDLNKLKNELSQVNLLCSIAIFNKNKDRGLKIVEMAKFKRKIVLEK
jgi:hypothetical protein